MPILGEDIEKVYFCCKIRNIYYLLPYQSALYLIYHISTWQWPWFEFRIQNKYLCVIKLALLFKVYRLQWMTNWRYTRLLRWYMFLIWYSVVIASRWSVLVQFQSPESHWSVTLDNIHRLFMSHWTVSLQLIHYAWSIYK